MRLFSTHIPIAVGAGLLVCVGATGPARAGTACPPTAMVEGAPEIVTPTAALLRRRGIGSGPSYCGRIVRASLAPRPNLGTYSLHIQDGYGRVSEREIADAGTAASLIESWVTDEDADVLAPRATPAAVETVTVAMPSPGAPPSAAWRVQVLGDVAAATDRSVWYGGIAAACGRVGPVCLGGRVRVAHDAEGPRTGPDAALGYDFTATWTRTRYGGGAIALLPLSRGPVTIAPAIGAGLVQTRTVLIGGPVDLTVAVLSVSAEAGIGVAVALSRHFSMIADVSGAVAYAVSSASSYSQTWWELVPSPPHGLIGLGIGVGYVR